MPPIYSGTCKSCGHETQILTSGSTYYIKDYGEIVVLPHPCEHYTLNEQGSSWTKATLTNRLASSSTVICQQCGLDTKRYEDKGVLFKIFQKDRYNRFRNYVSKNRECPNCGEVNFISLYTVVEEKIKCKCLVCKEREVEYVNCGIC